MIDAQTGKPIPPKEPYKYQRYPAMLYHAELGQRIVKDEADEAQHLEFGWQKQPIPADALLGGNGESEAEPAAEDPATPEPPRGKRKGK